MKYSIVLFDLDGTLIDSLADIAARLNEVREQLGLKRISDQAVARWVGKGAEYLVAGGIPEFPEQVAELTERYKVLYRERYPPLGMPYPTVVETLSRLQTLGVAMAIVTNKSQKSAEQAVDYYFPSIKFEAIRGPETVSSRKPDKAHLLECLADIGSRPSDALYIGDDPVDRDCARNANIDFLGALYGIGKIPADGIIGIKTLSELFQYLG